MSKSDSEDDIKMIYRGAIATKLISLLSSLFTKHQVGALEFGKEIVI